MKVIFFRINRIRICVLLSVMIGWACSEQITKSRETEETQYERMGRLHNEGLDYVLEQILITAPVTRGGERKLPTEEVIWQMCYDFTRKQGEEGLTRTSGTVGEGTPYSFLSDWQREWLIQIKETVWTLTPETLEAFDAAMKALEKKIQAETGVSAAEKEVILYAAAVCRYSAVYWAENYHVWTMELFGVETGTLSRIRSRSETDEFVTDEWWERYKTVVWSDGMEGIKTENGYYLQGAIAGSVRQYLKK